MVIIRKGRSEGETAEGGGGVDIRCFEVRIVKISLIKAIKVL